MSETPSYPSRPGSSTAPAGAQDTHHAHHGHNAVVTGQFGPQASAYLTSANHAQGADLEQLASDRAMTLAPPYPALDQAVTEAQGAADASATRIAALQRGLAPAT